MSLLIKCDIYCTITTTTLRSKQALGIASGMILVDSVHLGQTSLFELLITARQAICTYLKQFNACIYPPVPLASFTDFDTSSLFLLSVCSHTNFHREMTESSCSLSFVPVGSILPFLTSSFQVLWFASSKHLLSRVLCPLRLLPQNQQNVPLVYLKTNKYILNCHLTYKSKQTGL